VTDNSLLFTIYDKVFQNQILLKQLAEIKDHYLFNISIAEFWIEKNKTDDHLRTHKNQKNGSFSKRNVDFYINPPVERIIQDQMKGDKDLKNLVSVLHLLHIKGYSNIKRDHFIKLI